MRPLLLASFSQGQCREVVNWLCCSLGCFLPVISIHAGWEINSELCTIYWQSWIYPVFLSQFLSIWHFLRLMPPPGTRVDLMEQSQTSIGELKACTHSVTLPPTKPHLLRVPLTLGAIFFQTTHQDSSWKPSVPDPVHIFILCSKTTRCCEQVHK